ncbi:MAG TPA: hypothetical protein VMN03_06505, partial [Burkholderiales bacterium]|nr:hypothetical protein [Burkholderiales bacterium]
PLLVSDQFEFRNVAGPIRDRLTGVPGRLGAQVLPDGIERAWTDRRNRVTLAPFERFPAGRMVLFACDGGAAAFHALQQAGPVSGRMHAQECMEMRRNDPDFQDVRAFLPSDTADESANECCQTGVN